MNEVKKVFKTTPVTITPSYVFTFLLTAEQIQLLVKGCHGHSDSLVAGCGRATGFLGQWSARIALVPEQRVLSVTADYDRIQTCRRVLIDSEFIFSPDAALQKSMLAFFNRLVNIKLDTDSFEMVLPLDD